MLCNEYIESFRDRAPPRTLDHFQTHFEIFAWVNHTWFEIFMKLAHKKIEKIDQCLIIQLLRGGNLLYIAQ